MLEHPKPDIERCPRRVSDTTLTRVIMCSVRTISREDLCVAIGGAILPFPAAARCASAHSQRNTMEFRALLLQLQHMKTLRDYTPNISKHESSTSNTIGNVIYRRLSFTERREKLAVLLQQQIGTTGRDISRLHDASLRPAIVSRPPWHNQRRIISRTHRFERMRNSSHTKVRNFPDFAA